MRNVSTESETPAALAASYTHVSKTFGVTQALNDINLDVKTGTIHALVGENGAGKSTALGILAGRIAATSGRVEVFGVALPPERPRESRRLGVAAIYQELTIAPDLSAEANVFVGQPISRFGLLSSGQMRTRYEELCKQLGVPAVASSVPAGQLSIADQQLVEIMRAMASDARLILFDEPTASLGEAERRASLGLLRSMRAEGRTVVFVSHNLDEVLEVADEITVFRSGNLVRTTARSDVTKIDVIRSMLGDQADQRLLRGLEDESVPSTKSESKGTTTQHKPPVLRVEHLSLPGALDDISFEIHQGEILGLGGLVGCGRTSVLRSLAGLERRATGQLWIDGEEQPWPRTVRRALALGIALAPEDRKTQGLVLELPAETNVAMSDLTRVARGGWISQARLRSAARVAVLPFGFNPDRVGETPARLSGGNQQKLLLARWKYAEPRILLADEPTRGIDIGAKQDVLGALRDMAQRGLAVILVSSELEELVASCDRVDVLSEGHLAGRLDRTKDDLTVSAILEKAFSS